MVETLLKLPSGLQENSPFRRVERDSDRLFNKLKRLGIWNKMENVGLLEPALRCANLASNAAIKLNDLAIQSGSKPIVSSKLTFFLGLLFKSGQVIDEQLVSEYHLDELDPRVLNLYKYPSHSPERTIKNSNVLRLSLFLYQLGYPQFAKLVLHGPHKKFFEEAEIPNVLVSLTNANFSLNYENVWHSRLYPAVGLFAIPPYAQRIVELEPSKAKDSVDRARVVTLNATLQYILLMNANISFSDEKYELDKDELLQRWNVVEVVFKRLGIPFPDEGYLEVQSRHNDVLEAWMNKYDIINRLKKTQQETIYPLFDHCRMVGELCEHLGKELNKIAQQLGKKPILNEKYLYNIGVSHDALKAFGNSELEWLKKLKQYGEEFEQIFPSEVVATGRYSLDNSHDAQLYAWLRHFERNIIGNDNDGTFPSVAIDFLPAPYRLNTLMSAILSYSDMAVNDRDDGLGVRFEPNDVTNRFLVTTDRYILDPDTAQDSYAKSMTVAATLSTYLGIPLPKNGSKTVSELNLQVLQPAEISDEKIAAKNLGNISRVLRIFGIIVPQELRRFE